jgi:uncharacterized membrane protein YfcA
VGGGFLMTPLLVFYGIPPGIAVATQASHITASSLSGALAQWRRQGVDAKMGGTLLAGGFLGSAVGVYVFRILQQLGQIELVVTASYVILLGSIGGLMLNESIRTIRAVRVGGTSAAPTVVGQHSWIHGLPFKIRFRRSKLYISIIPPVVLGFLVGILTAIMGVGGGFILVPAMIYLLRMPTNVVIGTSQFQILFVTAATTILHATTDQTVDIVLAFLLVSAGFWASNWACARARNCAASNCALCWPFWSSGRAEAVGGLIPRRKISTPSSQARHEEAGLTTQSFMRACVFCPCFSRARARDDLVSGLSTDLIQITSNFTGTDIVLFGAIEPRKTQVRRKIRTS